MIWTTTGNLTITSGNPFLKPFRAKTLAYGQPLTKPVRYDANYGANVAFSRDGKRLVIQEYGGISVKINARLEAARIVVNVDVGFGDQVTPKPALVDFPTLLDFPSPRVRAYPTVTVVAEKFQAMVALGERNTRLKDFFDLLYLSSAFDFEGDTLFRAISGTFERRNTPLPSSLPVAMTDQFAAANEGMWSAFLRRSEQEQTLPFSGVVQKLRVFLEPTFNAQKRLPSMHWQKGGPWKSES